MTHDTERFDGVRSSAEGMAGQSWSAALFLLASEGLDQKIF